MGDTMPASERHPILDEKAATFVRLHNAVAADVLADNSFIADGEIDLILTDPPYIISRDSGFQKKDEHGVGGGLKRFQTYSTDFGGWDRDEFTMQDLDEVIQKFHRILKPGGVAVVFFDIWKVSVLAEMFKSAGFENISMIEWLKTNAVPINARKTYLSNAREIAVVASRAGARPTFRNVGDGEKGSFHSAGIFRHPIYHAKDRFHPTQKSLSLFEDLIGIHSAPGDVVLDCFSGSATTGVAAANMGRHYIGCEPDREFFDKSSDRLIAALRRNEAKAERLTA